MGQSTRTDTRRAGMGRHGHKAKRYLVTLTTADTATPWACVERSYKVTARDSEAAFREVYSRHIEHASEACLYIGGFAWPA